MEQNNLLLVLTTVFITVGLLALGAFGFWFFQQKIVSQQQTLPSPSALIKAKLPTVQPSPSPSAALASPGPSSSLSPSPAVAAVDQLRQAFAQKFNKPVSAVTVMIDELNEPYAKGGVKFSGEVGGGWFLAYKENEKWLIVADGNGTVNCADIQPYNFPVSMVPECWDEASQTLVTR